MIDVSKYPDGFMCGENWVILTETEIAELKQYEHIVPKSTGRAPPRKSAPKAKSAPKGRKKR